MSARSVILALLAFTLVSCGDGEGEEHEGEGEHGEHEGEEHEGEVHIDPDSMQTAGIRLGRAERRALSGGAHLPGEVRFDPMSTAHVSPLVAGRFESVEVQLGQRVERGQLLAIMASADASSARSGLAQAQARLAAAQAALERQRQLVSQGIAARRGLVEAEAEVRTLQAEMAGMRGQLGVLGTGRGSAMRLVAPIAGVVIQVHATPGEAASAEQEAFTIADPEAVSVYGEVPELAISTIREGLDVIFRPHAYPELALPGTIRYVAPAIEDETRSLPIRVVLAETDARLRSGMYGGIELVGDESRPIAVPVEAVVTIGGQSNVFVPGDEPGAFVPRPVELGRRAGAFYEIRSGLRDGARIVIAGAFTLKSQLQSGELSEGHAH